MLSWCEARTHPESERLLELLFPVSSCKNPILEKHSFCCLCYHSYYSGQALQNGLQEVFVNLVGTMWCRQHHWFLRPPNVFALKICFQLWLVLLDFVLRPCVRMCKPWTRMKVWAAACCVDMISLGRSKEGLLLLRGAVLSPSSRIPSCSLVQAAVLGRCEVKPIQNALQPPPAAFLLLISWCSAARAGAGPGEGVARSRSWSRRWQGVGTVADHRAALFSAAVLHLARL